MDSYDKIYKIGGNACATLLIKNGFLVISQRHFASRKMRYFKMNAGNNSSIYTMDHHENEMVQMLFSHLKY